MSPAAQRKRRAPKNETDDTAAPVNGQKSVEKQARKKRANSIECEFIYSKCQTKNNLFSFVYLFIFYLIAPDLCS